MSWLKISEKLPLYYFNIPDLFDGASRAKTPEAALRNVCYNKIMEMGLLHWNQESYSGVTGAGQLANDIMRAYDINEIADILTDTPVEEPKPEPVKTEPVSKPVQLELFK